VAELQKHLHNPAPEVMWCDRSYHVLTLDYERDDVNRAILKFFNSCHPEPTAKDLK
jgi:esterase/lipase